MPGAPVDSSRSRDRKPNPGNAQMATVSQTDVGAPPPDPNDRARKPNPGNAQMAEITRDDVQPDQFTPSYGTVDPGSNMEIPGIHEQWFQQNEGKFAEKGQADQFFQRTGEGYAQEGLGEKFASDNAGMLQSMGQGEQWWNKYGGGFNQASASEGLQQDPGLGAYYDRAKTRTAGSINDQLAARGSFGSSAGMQQIGDAMVGLEAERAGKEADYRAGIAGQADEARMTRMGLGGAFAGQAQDRAQGRVAQGMGMASQAQNQMLDRMMGGQNAAGAVDAQNLNQLIAGGNASMSSQQMGQNRVQAGLDNRIRTSDIASSVIGGGLNNIADNDQKLFEAMEALGMGGAAQNVNASQLNAAIASGDMDAVFALLGEAGNQIGNAAAAGGGGSGARADGAVTRGDGGSSVQADTGYDSNKYGLGNM